MYINLDNIEYYLPENILDNQSLANDFPEWTADKIANKLGIVERHICANDQCASDLGYLAAKKLFDQGSINAKDIDFVLFCTQSPDYFLPTTACILQDRLNIPTSAGALDFNLGCSGFIYGLSLAQGLISCAAAKNILLITADTYSKHLASDDKSTRTLFGDGAAATVIQADSNNSYINSKFVFGTDGRGANNLIVSGGGMRNRTPSFLYMNGPEIFVFTLRVVPKVIAELLQKEGKNLSDVDLFIFHQASKYILENLREKLDIPKEKFYIELKYSGNTVSSTIPIAIKNAQKDGVAKRGQLVMLVGFGVGYSWAATLIKI